MKKVQAYVTWIIFVILAMMLLALGFTGRLGILASIAFVPDNVATIQTP